MDTYEQFLSLSRRLESAKRLLVDHEAKLPPADDSNRLRLLARVGALQEEWWRMLERPLV